MPSPELDNFLRNVLSHVKFSFDRKAICSELESHLWDRIEDYLEQGYDEATAERLAVEGMGDPKEIGIELNKQHNPIIGWLW
ncbi:MAG: permease prefix domain 1-containing protein [Desulfitobacterium hafniense]|uniref:permease prefix domain 1-containing protein n=1 Tax=Desulfitobacterium hafniense TaxID=49338 RepID=UPI00036308A3|nr:permease prefix domain 1-containing protein [Desulfitobacterium hafniense]